MAKRGKLPKWAIKQAGGINKKAWRLARRGRKGTKKGQVRKTARRAFTRRNNPRKRMARRMSLPHPSITGMAAGFTLLDDLNRSVVSSRVAGGTGTVIDNVVKGQFNRAFVTLSSNSQNLIKTQTGRTALLQAVGIAAVGAWARKAFPSTKLGGSKLFFRI